MSRPANRSVIDQLRNKILSGGFEKTSFLPSERQLALEYEVGRAVVRGALRGLAAEKIIYRVPKRGWRIREEAEKKLKRIILRLPVRMSAASYEGMSLVAGICAGANDIFAEVILSAPPVPMEKEELLERCNAEDIQGIIFLEVPPDVPVEHFAGCGIPCVVANMEDDVELPCVRMDFRNIGRMAGQELLRCGYRNAAVFSGSQEKFIYRELLAGFRGALAEENITIPEEWIVSEKDFSTRLEGLLSLPASQRPEAFFTLRDYRAEILYEKCAAMGIKIPEDIGVISYDNVSWPSGARQGVTTISEDVYEIGRKSVLILQKMYERSAEKDICSIVQGSLVRRSSLKQKK